MHLFAPDPSEIIFDTDRGKTAVFVTTRGLVLRETQYKESSKMLTVLTESEGKLSVAAKGAMRRGSKLAPSAQLFAYSEMTLSQGKEIWTLTEARPLMLFLGLRESISGFALGSYFAQLLETVSDTDVYDPETLSLGLNALYALSRNLYPERQVKAAFELRLMHDTGFGPEADFCPVCGKVPEHPVLCPREGAVFCAECAPPGGGYTLCPGSLAAIQYILHAPSKKILAFRLEKDPLRRLSNAAEAYTVSQMEREMYTLNLYRQLREE